MHEADADKYWEYLGKTDPYWAVVTNERFQQKNIDDEAREQFFLTGERYVGWVFETIREYLDRDFAPKRSLDFGCGVGRLVLPLARRSDYVIGVDVAESMIREARANVDAQQLSNVSLIRDAGDFSDVVGKFDLINSYIVLQHIPCERGQQLVVKLLDRLNAGGVGVLHLTYSKEVYKERIFSVWSASAPGSSVEITEGFRAVRSWLRIYPRDFFRKLFRRGGTVMQMNPYTLNPIFHCLQSSGIRRMHLEFTDHGGEYGVLLFFQKSSESEYGAPIARVR